MLIAKARARGIVTPDPATIDSPGKLAQFRQELERDSKWNRRFPLRFLLIPDALNEPIRKVEIAGPAGDTADPQVQQEIKRLLGSQEHRSRDLVF